MPAFHLINRMYGRGQHRIFKHHCAQWDSIAYIRQRFDAIPCLMVCWDSGAYIKFRMSEFTIHVQELSNSSSGREEEGLYRWLVHDSGLPQLFKSWGVKTLTCEPSDGDAQARLGRYDVWEIWHPPGRHPVWMWWLTERNPWLVEPTIDFAVEIQEERRGALRSAD